MSKITEALKKIQDDRSAAPRPEPKLGRIEDSQVLAQLDENATVSLPEESFQVGRVVQIDRDAMRNAGLIAPESENKLFEDEYRVIKRPILANAFSNESKHIEKGYVVLVTSALSGEGKTFTCINLALSLARERDTSVLLVDADIPKPHITKLFDAEEEQGLLDFLDGSVGSIEELEIGTSESGLSILSTGRNRDNATELLSGSKMEELLNLVHARYPKRIVLIDSPPLLQTTEARALASSAGQIVTVVRAGITPKEAVLDAVAMLDQDKPVNLILNQVKQSQGSNYYSSIYGGGYGSAYGGAENEESD